MSISEVQGKVVPIKLWAPLDEVESKALDQLKNIAALPWVFKQVAAMPDVHFGYGATVGSVIAMKDAVSPAAVGVDIGCVDKDIEKVMANQQDLVEIVAELKQVMCIKG